MPAPNPLAVGSVFGRLTVTASDPADRRYYWCRCICGTEKRISRDSLRAGRTRSCGCLRSESSSARTVTLHQANTKHGKSGTRVHSVWAGMHDRCRNPNNQAFANYGARGIRVCERWNEFANFYADMGEPPRNYTLERIHNSRGYSPKNCKWASRQEQGNNRRANRRISLRGESHTIAAWSRLTGIHQNTISQRLDNGLPPAVALSAQRVQSPSKLTPHQVRRIRLSPRGPTELAKRYGVSPGNIVAIKQRRSWKHLPD